MAAPGTPGSSVHRDDCDLAVARRLLRGGARTPGEALSAAGLAATQGDWRLCADSYLLAYTSSTPSWPMRYYCWSGYTSVLADDHFVAPKADLKVLKSVAEDEAAPRLDRTAAAFTRGYCHKQAGNREAAARAYRLAIELGQGATPEERARSAIFSDQATSTWQPQASGKHFVSACYTPTAATTIATTTDRHDHRPPRPPPLTPRPLIFRGQSG